MRGEMSIGTMQKYYADVTVIVVLKMLRIHLDRRLQVQPPVLLCEVTSVRSELRPGRR